MIVNTLKRLVYRLSYRVSFFYFLRKIENKSTFILSFFPLLYYKLFPRMVSEYTTVVEIFGKKFCVRDLSDLMVIKETFYDQCYKYLFDGLSKPTTLIDLGSHIGDVALYSQYFPKVKKVIALEPDPRNIKILLKNIKLNNIKNVKFIPAAISGKTGEAYLNLGNESVASSLQQPKSVKSRLKVPTIALSDVMKMIKTPNIILKSDCEGAEYDFIMRTSPKVLAKINKIIVEYHMVPMKLKKVLSQLSKAGFHTTCIDLILEPNVGMAYTYRDKDSARPPVNYYWWGTG